MKSLSLFFLALPGLDSGLVIEQEREEHIVLYRDDFIQQDSNVGSRFGIDPSNIMSEHDFGNGYKTFLAHITADKARGLQNDPAVIL
jgi:hypothetical protein